MVLRASASAAVLLAATLAACGSTPRNAAPTPAQTARALRGSPAPLAALHAQANRLLGGEPAAFRARLQGLRGYPVVVNKWASWCGPCQSEFPSFQQASVKYGAQVAFVGLDGKDHDPAAASFLRRFPVSYPSYVDPQELAARAIAAATYYPQTIYLSRTGKIIYDHAGPYMSSGALEQDIRRYAISSR
ncbi:MAG: TlpA family protein disulfide reductase [Solirubrobacterales bacterium]|nr:TlpA family protein disulfide reductase [Solirubrobacterales bacterium]